MDTVVGGRYALVQTLGAGGMGVVYRGIDRQTDEVVAVKRLKSDIVIGNPDLLERFRREGDSLRRLSHPNIVHLRTMVEESGEHYLIMDYISGGDLNSLLRQGRLPLRRTLSIALDVADALTRAHRLGIIHRDLKPANVLIADDGTPRLTDFGVAHVDDAERVTATGVAVGTLDYLAPEAIAGNAATASTDIWAFGVMLFEMVSGERPFRADTPAAVLHAIITRQPPDLQALTTTETPIALIDLIYRMLEKEPDARIASVRQVGAELEAILQDRTTPAQRTTITPSTLSRSVHADADNEQTTTLPQAGRFATPTPNENGVETPMIQTPNHPVTPTPIPNNLPAQVTTFVGRTDELEALDTLIQSNRFVTIFAPGGMGKSRLALELGAQVLERFSDGVYFIELAPLNTPAAIPVTVANAIGFSLNPNDQRPTEVQLGAFLRDKTMLLILDNFEHVIGGASIVTTLLNAAPNLRIIVTSRQRLNLSGETLFSLGGLRFPEYLTPADAMHYGAIQLFMHSARRARPGYELSADDVADVVRICQIVQGMPLGIVLAASWLSVLSPAEIAAEVAQSAAFLESDISDLPERQRGMRAVFEYSWNLLDETERAALMKLSIFRDDFSREAAQAVTGANLRLLMALTNKSLLRRDPESGRYTIHELLRQFAEEHLNTSPDAASTWQKFSEYFYDLAVHLISHETAMNPDWLRRMNQEFMHVIAAWEYFAEQGDTERVDAMIDTIYGYARASLSYDMGVMLFDNMRRILPMPADDNTPVSRAARRLMTHFEAMDGACEVFERGIRLAQREGDEDEEAFCMFGTAMVTADCGDYAHALQLFDQLAVTMPESMRRIYLPLIFTFSSLSAARMGDIDDAHRRLEASVEQMRQQSDMLAWMTEAQNWLGIVRLVESEFADDFAGEIAALTAEMQSLIDIQRQYDYRQGAAITAMALAMIRLRAGDVAGATASIDEAQRFNRKIGESYLIQIEQSIRAETLLVEGRYADARRIYDGLDSSNWMGDLPTSSPMGRAVLALMDHRPQTLDALRAIRDRCLLSPLFYRRKFGADALYAQGYLLMLAAHYEQRGDLKTAAALAGLFERGKDRAARHWVENVPLFAELPARLESALGSSAYADAVAGGTDEWALALVEGL